MSPLARRLLVLCVIGAIVGAGFLAMPHLVNEMGRVRYREMGVEMARIRSALDSGRIPYPARSGARTTAAYLKLLIEAGVLRPGDRLFFKDWVVADLDPADPPGTVFLATKSYYAYATLEKKDARGFAFAWLDGRVMRSYDPPADKAIAVPPLLPPE